MSLRLIILLLGLLGLGLLVLLHRPEGESRRNHARWRLRRQEPVLGDSSDVGVDGPEPALSFPGLDEGEQVRSSGPGAHVSTAGSGRPGERQNGRRFVDVAVRKPPGSDRAPEAYRAPDKIISLYIRRLEGRQISGSELLDAAIKAGLEFGEMNIFHRRQEGESNPIFSMANLVAPGSFNPSEWNLFTTPGVSLFLALPNPLSALHAWDALLATGERISRLLNAEILDDAEAILSRQRIAQIREEMREYDRKSIMPRSS